MQDTRVAIATRVAPSFLRVGQIELFARRVRSSASPEDRKFRLKELKQIVSHLLVREYSHLSDSVVGEFADVVQEDANRQKTPEAAAADKMKDPDLGGRTIPEFQSHVLAMLDEFSNRMAAMTTGWMRVGFVQGNFNSDNCLAGGRTMDYGPFGFMQNFEKNWNMWTNGGDHFSYWNQPKAGYVGWCEGAAFERCGEQVVDNLWCLLVTGTLTSRRLSEQ